MDHSSCTYCLRTFPTAAITDWIDGGRTPLCPYCRVDSLMPGLAEREELERQHIAGFGGLPPGFPEDPFRQWNEDIAAFVANHKRLAPGTGEYSSLFRGRLFGSNNVDYITLRVASRRVDVLWLGSNPNVPESVRYILEGGGSDLADFVEHRKTNRYAPAPPPGRKEWQPMERGGGWSVYRDVLQRCFRADHIAFANVIPWGSHVAPAFFGPMSKDPSGLLAELMEFSRGLNERVIATLRPRLIVLPRILVESTFTRPLDLRVEGEALGVVEVAGKKQRFTTGELVREGVRWPVLVGPHPSALRPRAHERAGLVETLVERVRGRWPDLPTVEAAASGPG